MVLCQRGRGGKEGLVTREGLEGLEKCEKRGKGVGGVG